MKFLFALSIIKLVTRLFTNFKALGFESLIFICFHSNIRKNFPLKCFYFDLINNHNFG